MKRAIKFLILFVTLLAFSCSESTDMVTVINPDGSCYREFKEMADSAFMFGDTTERNNPFPVKIDSTCIIAWKYGNNELRTDFPLSKSIYDSIITSVRVVNDVKFDKEDKKINPFTVVLRKDYKSVEEMAEKFRLKPSHEWSSMKVKYALDKKFRWFYTYYTYKETYPKIETNFTIPIENYMTTDEARFWFTGEPNMLQGMNGIEIREYIGNLEDKYNKWFAQNSWNDQYKVLIANYDQIDKKPVTKERLELLKDSIFLSQVKDFEDFKTEIILNEYFHTKAFSELWKDNDSPMKKYDDDFSNQLFVGYFGKSFTYNLKMPGKITLPNNAVIKGDTLVWRLTAYRMGHDDYVIGAQSRRANIWTFILTGIVLAIAVGSFLIKPKKRL